MDTTDDITRKVDASKLTPGVRGHVFHPPIDRSRAIHAETQRRDRRFAHHLHIPLQLIDRGGFSRVYFRHDRPCPDCNGQGRRENHCCMSCDGHGRVQRLLSQRVYITPGLEEGAVIALQGHGFPGELAAEWPGELLVSVHSLPDQHFHRHHDDLFSDLYLSVSDAILGTVLWIPTLQGSLRVRIPPLSRTHQILRIRGRGLMNSGGERGDLHIHVRIRLPKQLDRQQRRLYRRLAGLRHHSVMPEH